MLHNKKLFLLQNLNIIYGYPHLPWELYEILNVGQVDLFKIVTGIKNISPNQIEELSLCLETSIEHLLFHPIDYAFLDNKFNNQSILPHKYEVFNGIYARSKTIQTMVNFLNSHIQHNLGNILAHRLGISSQLYQQPNIKINPTLIMDALKEISALGVSPDLLTYIGRSADVMSYNNKYLMELGSISETKKVLEFIHDEIIKEEYDNLFLYKINHITTNKASITITPRIARHKTISKGEIIGNRELCKYKQGVYLSFLKYKKISQVKMLESACLYHGNKHCQYHLSWKNEYSNEISFH